MSRRRLVRVTLLVILFGLSAGAIGLALGQQPVGHPTRPAPRPMIAPSQGFAGYFLLGPVHQIHAQWAIPAITPTSPTGHASTWIGVDDNRGDFIQLGSIEDRLSSDGAPFYTLFWSDTALGDLAHEFAPVEPGDQVSFDMRQTSAGWQLKADLIGGTRGAPFHITSHYGAGLTFSRALWLQENPVLSLQPLTYKSYPDIPSVTIADVATNGQPRQLPYTDSQAMATNTGGLLVPTKMLSNAFTLLPAAGIDRVYLNAAGAVDLYFARLDADLRHLRGPGANSPTARADGRQLANAITGGDVALFALPWSPVARPLAARFIAHNAALATDLQRWLAATTARTRGAALVMALHDALGNGGYSVPLRAALGLPPPA